MEINLYAKQFSESLDFPEVEGPTKIIVIASTPRCGSHMLGHAMWQTSQFGFPLEYLNPRNLSVWRKRFCSRNVADTLSAIERKRTSPNGVFGIKIHYSQLRQLGGFAGLAEYFPHACYVLLSRADVLMQAVSYSVALQTGVWIAGQKPINGQPLRYDFGQH